MPFHLECMQLITAMLAGPAVYFPEKPLPIADPKNSQTWNTWWLLETTTRSSYLMYS